MSSPLRRFIGLALGLGATACPRAPGIAEPTPIAPHTSKPRIAANSSGGAAMASVPIDPCRSACARRGTCALSNNGECVVAKAEDCHKSELCQSDGRCSLVAGRCDAGTNEECRRSPDCAKLGWCTFRRKRSGGDGCIATTREECAQTVACRNAGECTPIDDECRPGSDEECRRSPDCAKLGHCTFRCDKCIAATRDDCKRTVQCRDAGACTPFLGECKPGSTSECHRAPECKELGRCEFHGGACLVPAGSAAECRKPHGTKREAPSEYYQDKLHRGTCVCDCKAIVSSFRDLTVGDCTQRSPGDCAVCTAMVGDPVSSCFGEDDSVTTIVPGPCGSQSRTVHVERHQ